MPVLLARVLLLATVAVSATSAPGPGTPETADWEWPLASHRIVLAHFRAPEHSWSAGHRGIDLPAHVGQQVSAPTAGVIAFRGVVVDRPLITIAHEGNLVTTLEPVLSELAVGDWVTAGQIVGTVAIGGHTPPGALHLGVRWHGAYINPLHLFGGIPRAVLLPCCY